MVYHVSQCQITDSFNMEHRGVVLMKEGTQTALKHMVRGNSKKKKELRYSLSFRALAKKSHATAESQPACPSNTLQNNPAPSQSTAQPAGVSMAHKRHVCLIAGDSYAQRLDIQKLGRRSVIVESVARGGAQIHHVMGQLKGFATSNTDTVVDKICVSVGTNDIRYCKDFSHLKLKLKSLCSLINEMFPKSKVYFQTLIPLPCLHGNDWNTNRKVLDFNKIIINECIFRRYHVIDAFTAFVAPRRYRFSPELRNPLLFSCLDIHPSEHRGMGALAKLYIRAVHNKSFDQFIFQ